MRKIIGILIAGLAISAIGLFGADNSLGTWKRNVAKSKYTPTPANPITSLTMVREASEGGVKSTGTGQRKDGTAINSVYTAKYDGKEYPVYKIEISAESHPFYTGKQKIVDTAGRVDKFKKRYARKSTAKAAE